MKILMTGVTGRLGQELGKKLVLAGHQLVALARDPPNAELQLPFPAKIFAWNASEPVPLKSLEGVEVIYHLAGESVMKGRWTTARKTALRDSRVSGTRRLVAAIELLEKDKTSKLRHFISASACGFYGDTGDIPAGESHRASTDFLGELCQSWEREAEPLHKFNIRVVHLRLGLVLEAHGGALQVMLPFFLRGLGAQLGKGYQWMSWIHKTDAVDMFLFALHNTQIAGPMNAIAPVAVRNAEFSKRLAENLGKKLRLSVPDFAIKILYGELSEAMLQSTRASAEKAQQAGFRFRFPTLDLALEEICTPLRGGQHELISEQWIPRPPAEIFTFFSDAKNLETMTPKFLNFKVMDQSTLQIEEGTLLNYQLSPYGIHLKWQSRIDEWVPGQRFVDTQLKGPYQKWLHTHEFIPMAGGTLLKDRVLYKPPLGTVGNWLGGSKVTAVVKGIFDERREAIGQRFGTEIPRSAMLSAAP